MTAGFVHDDWRPGASRLAVEARAALLSDIRAYFRVREVMEVDLTNGNRTQVASDISMNDSTWDPVGGRPLFLDFANNALSALDLGSGEATVVSDQNTGVGPTFSTSGCRRPLSAPI